VRRDCESPDAVRRWTGGMSFSAARRIAGFRWWILTAVAFLGVASACSSAGKAVVTNGGGAGTRPLPLISRGSVQPLFLADGTPVWEIRHRDGSVSVLGAAVSPAASSLSGLETVTVWLKQERHFSGGAIYNEYGRAIGYPAPNVGGNPPLPTTARDMTSYAVRIVGNKVEVGHERIGMIRSGFDAHRPVSGAGAYAMDQVLTF